MAVEKPSVQPGMLYTTFAPAASHAARCFAPRGRCGRFAPGRFMVPLSESGSDSLMKP